MASTTGLPEFVWYASYGSNLNRARFMAYIEGGSVAGNDVVYEGCTDAVGIPPTDRCTRALRTLVERVGRREDERVEQVPLGGVSTDSRSVAI
jgi:hypothetical protein